MARHTSRHRGERSGRPAWFGRGRTRALLSAGALLGVGAVGTAAYWNEAVSVPGVALHSGAIHIDLASNNRVKPETYTWSDLSSSLPATGGSVARVIRVKNDSIGRLVFGYTVSAAATGTLGSSLKVTVVKGGTTGGSTCKGTNYVGTPSSNLNGFSGSAGTLSATDPTPFHDLCVQLTLPSGSGVGGSQSSTVTFTFNATQVIS